eukprot:CAMPEP_0176409588 /NCGR_PEP_ID=MMETSP0127-20121128/2581_1 /TAXON_ID=938130 /ORGANISM="Platyophrya macrostoma, Strain WH" /LENGTH=303 /DNA_ID=CAMNT_0017788983 /DNA_START=213 /DNA_END=1122 /DNA_ORIENTATION=-
MKEDGGVLWPEAAFDVIALSIFHGCFSADDVATLCDPEGEVATRCVAAECLRWPDDVEAELIKKNSACIRSPTKTSVVTAEESEATIARYWSSYHGVLAPGDFFHTDEMQHIASRYYVILEETSAVNDPSSLRAKDWSELLSLIASQDFGADRRFRASRTFWFHTPESLDTLWRRSRSTLRDMFMHSAATPPHVFVSQIDAGEGLSNVSRASCTLCDLWSKGMPSREETAVPSQHTSRWRTALRILMTYRKDSGSTSSFLSSASPSLVQLRAFVQTARAENVPDEVTKSVVNDHICGGVGADG